MSLPPKEEQGSSLYAALARTATRSAALYFSRPVRLFRPAKVSGWNLIKSLASQHGAPLTPQYILGLVKQQGFMVIPRHFVPPILVNAALGTVLWTTYAETVNVLGPHLSGNNHILLAAASGATAGGMQAIFAAPAENVRIVLEGGSGAGWSHAWKEVFRGTNSSPSATKKENLQEMRQVRNWMKEVKGMTGRGWDGWGWGCAKDICGFAAFFTVFEITRGVAWSTKTASQTMLDEIVSEDSEQAFQRHFPRTVHAITLVTGGVIAGLAYEIVSRPWDIARKAVYLDRVTHSPAEQSPLLSVMRILKEDGIIEFFRNPATAADNTTSLRSRRKLYTALRALTRVGPWGIGFLTWEAFGPGLS